MADVRQLSAHSAARTIFVATKRGAVSRREILVGEQVALELAQYSPESSPVLTHRPAGAVCIDLSKENCRVWLETFRSRSPILVRTSP